MFLSKCCQFHNYIFFPLSFTGYISRGLPPTSGSGFNLENAGFCCPHTVALIIVGLVILHSYRVDEERRQGNRELLQEQSYGCGLKTLCLCLHVCEPHLKLRTLLLSRWGTWQFLQQIQQNWPTWTWTRA